MSEYSYLIHTDKLVAMHDAIVSLEAEIFGPEPRFSTSYGKLRINGSLNDNCFERIRDTPDLDTFAKDLNDAIKPVCERYIAKLRIAYGVECLKQAQSVPAAIKPLPR